MKRIYDIGWKRQTPKGGTLEIISRDKDFLYLTCSLCHLDEDLFPLPLKVPILQSSELKNKNPCACSNRYPWSFEQRCIQIKRLCNDIGYIFHGCLEAFAGNSTYLDLENPKTGNRWTTCNINNFLNNKRRDPSDTSYLLTKKVPIVDRIAKVEHLLTLESISQKLYLNDIQINNEKLSYSKFTWYCKRGHKCTSTFNNFINHGTRCSTCYKVNRSSDQGFNGFADKYYAKHKDRDDYLYILQLDGNGECFHKIGRTFNMSQRMSAIRTKSPYKVTVLYMEKDSHFNIYSREKKLLNDTLDQSYTPLATFGGWTEARLIYSLDYLFLDRQL